MVRISFSALCGSDFRVMEGVARVKAYDPQDIILGHSWSGTIAEKGPGVHKFRIGQAVYGSAYMPCGTCGVCRAGQENLCDRRMIEGVEAPGAHAEFMMFPVAWVRPLPSGLDLRAAALISDSVTVADHAIDQADLDNKKAVGIYGAGPTGLAIGMLLRHAYGVKDLWLQELSSYRRALAKKLFYPSALRSSNKFANRLDIAFEASGAPAAFNDAFHMVRRGGSIIVVGCHDRNVSVNMFKVVTRHIRISGTFVYPMSDLASVEKLAKHIHFERIVTHEFRLSEASRAYELFRSGKSGAVLLRP